MVLLKGLFLRIFLLPLHLVSLKKRKQFIEFLQ